MSADLSAPTTSADWMRRGQQLEAEGTPLSLTEAVRAYDAALTLLRIEPAARGHHRQFDLAIAWMNRGNALQKQPQADAVRDGIASYDQAITLLQELPLAEHAPFRNSLGAAWMNRGHALLQLNASTHVDDAIESHRQAVKLLRTLPSTEVAGYALNLAGAEINLANALLLRERAPALLEVRQCTDRALLLVAARETTASEFADVGLKARRAACDAIGRQLVEPGADQNGLAHQASDLVDEGLTLARRWEERGVPHFRLLALRLFRFGAQLYRLHQPQFLAEFLAEQLAVFSAPEFQAIALETIDAVLRGQPGDPLLVAGDPASERRRELTHDLRRVRASLAGLSSAA